MVNHVLGKNSFRSMNTTKLGEKEFLKLYIVLLRAELNCTNNASWMCQVAGASKVTTRKVNVRFQKFFFPCFCIHS